MLGVWSLLRRLRDQLDKRELQKSNLDKTKSDKDVNSSNGQMLTNHADDA